MLTRTISVNTKTPVPDQVLAGVVEVYDDAVPNPDELLQIASGSDFSLARVGWDANVGHERPDVRDSTNTFIYANRYDAPLAWYELGRTIFHYLDTYGNKYYVGFSAVEPFVVNRYEPGQRYHAHADAGPAHPRVISALLYLNDIEVGGETRFIFHDVEVRPKAGRLIIFPSNYAYSHAALPPVSGTKYSVAIWTRV